MTKEEKKDIVLGIALLKISTKDNKPFAYFLGQTQDLSKVNVLVRSKAAEFMKFAFR